MSRRSVLMRWAVVAVLVLGIGAVAYAMGTGGDNAEQPVAGQDDQPMPVEPDEGAGDSPMPVEPDEGIGDSPMPVEPDEGIGDTRSDTGY